MRIIADHLKAVIFILGDEKQIKPSNVEQGYVIRRLIRRAIRYGKIIGINKPFTHELVEPIMQIYPDYNELKKNKNFIISQLNEEENKFNKTLNEGIKKFNDIIKTKEKTKIISGKDAFLLFQSYGFPIEMTKELADEKNIKVDLEAYKKEYETHQKLSRTASAGMFKSGLADNSEITTRLHTATHILNQALRIVLKDDNIKQKGSNINPERLRFDFNFPRKLTDDEIKKIENFVNEKIAQKLEVKQEQMPLKKAISLGAQAEFGAKYPNIVTIYTIENFSKEICAGPHVKNTKDIGKIKIIKEESVAMGVRRIKAVVSN